MVLFPFEEKKNHSSLHGLGKTWRISRVAYKKGRDRQHRKANYFYSAIEKHFVGANIFFKSKKKLKWCQETVLQTFCWPVCLKPFKFPGNSARFFSVPKSLDVDVWSELWRVTSQLKHGLQTLVPAHYQMTTSPEIDNYQAHRPH